MGSKQMKTLKQELCLINPSVNSTLLIQSLFPREEIKLTAEWKMGLKTIF
jgi:hypothetical protein